MARGFTGLLRRCISLVTAARCFAGIFAVVVQAQPSASSTTSRPTAWGPSEDPALICAEADQSRTLKPGDTETVFTFSLTNVSEEDVVVLNVLTSCGCAMPKHPPTPWRIGRGQRSEFQIVMDLRGKTGTVEKGAAVETQKGVRPLMMRVKIPPGPNSAAGLMRQKNMQTAIADRQAVFKGDCVRCHVTPAVGLVGQPLYAAACGICHDAEHRASMVPNLRTLDHPTNRDFWLHTITEGKPSTLMPAFGRAHGGPLTTAQIESLAKFLTETFSPLHPPLRKMP